MATINGVGTRYLGYSKATENECYWLTEWFTVLFFPIIPLNRYKFKISIVNDEPKYEFKEQSSLVRREVISTYLWCWVAMLLLLIGPMVITAVLTETKTVDTHSTLFSYLLGGSFIWFVAASVLIYSWDQKRGLPGKKGILGRFLD